MNEISGRKMFQGIIDVGLSAANLDPIRGVPRTSTYGYGIISQYAIKRYTRDFIFERKLARILSVQTEDADEFKARNSLFWSNNEIQKAGGDIKKIKEAACKEWFDNRAYGLMVLNKAEKNKTKKQQEAEEEGTNVVETGHEESFGITGAVSIGHAVSVSPIAIERIPGTTSFNQKLDGYQKESSTFGGSQSCIWHGLYTFFGGVDDIQARTNGFTEKDSELLRKALEDLFEHNPSSLRPMGSISLCGLIWYDHVDDTVKAGQVMRALHITPKCDEKITRSVNDYNIELKTIPGAKCDIDKRGDWGANVKLT